MTTKIDLEVRRDADNEICGTVTCYDTTKPVNERKWCAWDVHGNHHGTFDDVVLAANALKAIHEAPKVDGLKVGDVVDVNAVNLGGSPGMLISSYPGTVTEIDAAGLVTVTYRDSDLGEDSFELGSDGRWYELNDSMTPYVFASRS